MAEEPGLVPGPDASTDNDASAWPRWRHAPDGWQHAGWQGAGRQGAGRQSAGGPQDGAATRQSEQDQVPGWMGRLRQRWAQAEASHGPFRRAREGHLAGGLSSALALRTGFDVTLVRLVVVVLSLLSTGWVAAIYAVAWLVMPASDTGASIGRKALADHRGIGLAGGVASVLTVALILASALNASWISSFAIPLIICAAVLVLLWRNAAEDEQALLRRLFGPLLGLGDGTRTARPVRRLLIACALLGGGLWALLDGHARYDLLLPLGGIMLLMAAIAVALGPWWLRIARDLVEERQARVRAEERAEMASRVHDSVLQTLALIQRRSGDPHQVLRLARAQERELRSWLFDGRAPGSLEGQATTVADAVRLIQQDVEADHGMTVDAVTVGDCALDDDLSALLAAAREATVNAAKWSGAEVVSVFAEVEPDTVSVFIRDRGRGFDPQAVPLDRKGLAESVQARLARRGGLATIRSAPGEGTEVTLTMPRATADQLSRRS